MVFERPRPIDPTRPTVTIKQACQLVQVSRSTINAWMKQGKIDYVQTVGGGVRIYAETLWKQPFPPHARSGHAEAACKSEDN